VSVVRTIWVKGLWHQGLVAAGVWSSRGFRVIGICDSLEEVIALKKSQLPIYEPGLEELITRQIENGNLDFSMLNSREPLPDVISFMHDTEVNDDDEVQLEQFFQDVKKLSDYISPKVEVLITSQVPAGTCREVQEILFKSLGFEPHVSYMPENLRLGQAIARFESPELPVIGISHMESKVTLEQLFKEDIQFKYCLLLEAELLKSALNSLLALSITFGNEISEICDQFEVSGSEVMSLLKLEPRVGKSLPLLPGLPFSGGTLGRDVQNLRKLSSRKSSLVDAIWQSNFDRKEYFINVVAKIAKSSGEDSIGLLGLTYKTGTSTLRRSFPLQCGQSLTKMGFRVYGFDPMAKSFDEEINARVHLCDSIEEIFEHCNILVITTPWEEMIRGFSIDLVKNKTIIDPYGVLSKELVQACTYKRFGGRM